MRDVVFVRHGATDLSGTFCGHLDSPLNSTGRRQAAELAEALKGLHAGAVYSSDLLRAQDTAKMLALNWRIPVCVSGAWREIAFGAWEGLTWAQIEGSDAEFARRWVAEFPGLAAPGGEIFACFEARVLESLERVRSEQRPGAEKTVVVTHGGVMRVVLEHVAGASAADAWAITREYCSSFRLRASGDVEVLC